MEEQPTPNEEGSQQVTRQALREWAADTQGMYLYRPLGQTHTVLMKQTGSIGGKRNQLKDSILAVASSTQPPVSLSHRSETKDPEQAQESTKQPLESRFPADVLNTT